MIISIDSVDGESSVIQAMMLSRRLGRIPATYCPSVWHIRELSGHGFKKAYAGQVYTEGDTTEDLCVVCNGEPTYRAAQKAYGEDGLETPHEFARPDVSFYIDYPGPAGNENLRKAFLSYGYTTVIEGGGRDRKSIHDEIMGALPEIKLIRDKKGTYGRLRYGLVGAAHD